MREDQDITLNQGHRNQDGTTFYRIATVADEIIEKCVIELGMGGIESDFSSCAPTLYSRRPLQS